jgi:hypothetical protein
MNRVAIYTLAALVVGCAGTDQATTEGTTAAEQSSGSWITLFDGSNLDNFNQVGDANWEIEDGYVGATSGNGFLVSLESYADFELTLEFWVSDAANSGVFIRASDPGVITAANSYEVNIFDTRPDPTYRTGGIVNVSAPASTINTGGQWNSYQITAEGQALTVVLNGTETVSARDDQLMDGPFALQYGNGTADDTVVRFRNVQIRPL